MFMRSECDRGDVRGPVQVCPRPDRPSPTAGRVRAVGADRTLGPLGPSFEHCLPFLCFYLGIHSSESTILHSCIVLPLPLKREDRLRVSYPAPRGLYERHLHAG